MLSKQLSQNNFESSYMYLKAKLTVVFLSLPFTASTCTQEQAIVEHWDSIIPEPLPTSWGFFDFTPAAACPVELTRVALTYTPDDMQ